MLSGILSTAELSFSYILASFPGRLFSAEFYEAVDSVLVCFSQEDLTLKLKQEEAPVHLQ